ncbi:Inner membrane protein YjdF [compost metagenome]
MSQRSTYFHLVLLFITLSVLAWSGIAPKDRFTWVLEVSPVFIGVALALFTYRRFPLTNLLYTLIAIHCVVLSVGGKYTYAEVPVGYWIQELFHFSRNHYDRLGHFLQGFVPAILAREILIRKNVVNGNVWRFLFVVCICLSFSAFYELIEWWAAVLTGEGATAFLGTQGDVWDTQWDMFIALVGAISAQLILGRVHDKQLSALARSRGK